MCPKLIEHTPTTIPSFSGLSTRDTSSPALSGISTPTTTTPSTSSGDRGSSGHAGRGSAASGSTDRSGSGVLGGFAARTSIGGVTAGGADTHAASKPDPHPAAGAVAGAGWGSVWVALAWLGVKILAIAGVVVLVFTMVFVLVRVSDETMAPALATGDTAVVYRLGGDYALGDVVALDYQGERQLRRVVAGGGDTVDITADGLEVNGAIQYEPRITSETLVVSGGITLPVTLSEDEVFVLADDRTGGGTDSRVYGPIKIADALGKTITLIRRTSI